MLRMKFYIGTKMTNGEVATNQPVFVTIYKTVRISIQIDIRVKYRHGGGTRHIQDMDSENKVQLGFMQS